MLPSPFTPTPAPGSQRRDTAGEAFTFFFAFVGFFDPPLTPEFHFATLDGSAFKAIEALPTGIDSDNLFNVSVGTNDLGQFAGGQSVDFVALTGGPVGEFKVSGINPLVDAGSPTAFPIKLSFLTESADFVMSPDPLPEFSLPTPWVSDDVGPPELAGLTTFTNGIFTVAGSGNDIGNGADAFQFAYRRVSGDCEIVARVLSLEPIDPWAKAGVMIRETLAAGSPHAFSTLSKSNGSAFQVRFQTDAQSSAVTGPANQAPGWVKVKRLGSRFTGYSSTNDVTWMEVGSTEIPMAKDVYVGLAVTSHDANQLSAAQFDGVNVTFTNGSSAGSGRNVFFESFDTLVTPNGGTASGWAYGSGVSGVSRTFTDGYGIFGGRALQLAANFSDLTSGAAIQYARTSVSGVTSTNLADYQLQFDLKATLSNVSVDFFIQTWPNNDFGGTMTGTRSGPTQLTVPANTFQTVILNLGDTNLTGLFDPLGKTWQLAWQMNSAQWGGDGSSQALTIDNVLLSLVPKVIAPVRLESFSFNGLGQPQFVFSGQAGTSYIIQSSSNLVDWITVTNFLGAGATQTVVLPEPTNGPTRFFRSSASLVP